MSVRVWAWWTKIEKLEVVWATGQTKNFSSEKIDSLLTLKQNGSGK